MNLTSHRWTDLYKSNPATWTTEMLEPCTGDELEALCRLLGIPHSGTKQARIARLLDMAKLRTELRRWGTFTGHEEAHALASKVEKLYTRKTLVALARRAGVYHGVPKHGIVIGLLSWREKCRQAGQEFDKQLRDSAVKQFVLPM